VSVLIECLTLVMQTKELDMRYPGGATAFLEATLEVEQPPRFVCCAFSKLCRRSSLNSVAIRGN
jgi:hypothetical protein